VEGGVEKKKGGGRKERGQLAREEAKDGLGEVAQERKGKEGTSLPREESSRPGA